MRASSPHARPYAGLGFSIAGRWQCNCGGPCSFGHIAWRHCIEVEADGATVRRRCPGSCEFAARPARSWIYTVSSRTWRTTGSPPDCSSCRGHQTWTSTSVLNLRRDLAVSVGRPRRRQALPDLGCQRGYAVRGSQFLHCRLKFSLSVTVAVALGDGNRDTLHA